MKIIKTASGKKKIKISKLEWKSIGKQAGWMKGAQAVLDVEKDIDSYELQQELAEAFWNENENENEYFRSQIEEELQEEGIRNPSDEDVQGRMNVLKEKELDWDDEIALRQLPMDRKGALLSLQGKLRNLIERYEVLKSQEGVFEEDSDDFRNMPKRIEQLRRLIDKVRTSDKYV